MERADLSGRGGTPHETVEGAVVLEDGRIVFPLRRPITLKVGEEERTVDQVELDENRLGAGAMRKLDTLQGAVARSLYIIEVLSGLNRAQVDKLGARDFDDLDTLAAGFLSDGPRTGPTS
jgi:hypothetical protein